MEIPLYDDVGWSVALEASRGLSHVVRRILRDLAYIKVEVRARGSGLGLLCRSYRRIVWIWELHHLWLKSYSLGDVFLCLGL